MGEVQADTDARWTDVRDAHLGPCHARDGTQSTDPSRRRGTPRIDADAYPMDTRHRGRVPRECSQSRDVWRIDDQPADARGKDRDSPCSIDQCSRRDQGAWIGPRGARTPCGGWTRTVHERSGRARTNRATARRGRAMTRLITGGVSPLPRCPGSRRPRSRWPLPACSSPASPRPPRLLPAASVRGSIIRTAMTVASGHRRREHGARCCSCPHGGQAESTGHQRQVNDDAGCRCAD